MYGGGFRERFRAEGKREDKKQQAFQPSSPQPDKNPQKEESILEGLLSSSQTVNIPIALLVVGCAAYVIKKKLEKNEQNQQNIERMHEAKVLMRNDNGVPNLAHGQVMATLHPAVGETAQPARRPTAAPAMTRVDASEEEKDRLILDYYNKIVERDHTILGLQSEVMRLQQALENASVLVTQEEQKGLAKLESLKEENKKSLQSLQTLLDGERAISKANKIASEAAEQRILELQDALNKSSLQQMASTQKDAKVIISESHKGHDTKDVKSSAPPPALPARHEQEEQSEEEQEEDEENGEGDDEEEEEKEQHESSDEKEMGFAKTTPGIANTIVPVGTTPITAIQQKKEQLQQQQQIPTTSSAEDAAKTIVPSLFA